MQYKHHVQYKYHVQYKHHVQYKRATNQGLIKAYVREQLSAIPVFKSGVGLYNKIMLEYNYKLQWLHIQGGGCILEREQLCWVPTDLRNSFAVDE